MRDQRPFLSGHRGTLRPSSIIRRWSGNYCSASSIARMTCRNHVVECRLALMKHLPIEPDNRLNMERAIYRQAHSHGKRSVRQTSCAVLRAVFGQCPSLSLHLDASGGKRYLYVGCSYKHHQTEPISFYPQIQSAVSLAASRCAGLQLGDALAQCFNLHLCSIGIMDVSCSSGGRSGGFSPNSAANAR